MTIPPQLHLRSPTAQIHDEETWNTLTVDNSDQIKVTLYDDEKPRHTREKKNKDVRTVMMMISRHRWTAAIWSRSGMTRTPRSLLMIFQVIAHRVAVITSSLNTPKITRSIEKSSDTRSSASEQHSAAQHSIAQRG